MHVDTLPARLEATVAVEAILDHLPNVCVAPGFEPVFEDSFILRGMRALPLTFDTQVTGNR